MAEARERRGSARPEPETREEALKELKEARRRLVARNGQIAELQAKLAAASDGDADATNGVRPENIIWIFCTGRSGSTWLGSMMGDIEGHAMWNEPLVGQLFGEFYYVRAAHKKGGKAIMGRRYKDVWLRSVRSMVLDGATARYPELAGEAGGYLTIKEPHGSIGAPLLSEALPQSRLVFLVRDPRDVAASALDGQKAGSWTSKHRRWEGKRKETTADTDPNAFVRKRARVYAQDIGNSREAYETHQGPKSLVKYEELRADTLGTMRRIYSELGVPVDDAELARVVEAHSWENIPEEDKGEGKFYRKATPEGWREDLTPEQIRVVEDLTGPILKEFYA